MLSVDFDVHVDLFIEEIKYHRSYGNYEVKGLSKGENVCKRTFLHFQKNISSQYILLRSLP